MEGIARSADVAKATVYAYFPTKQVVFDAACALRARSLIEQAHEAGAQQNTPAAAATASLKTKFATMFELLQVSPHAPELLEASNSSEHVETAQSHTDYIEALGALLRQALQLDKQDAELLAEVTDRALEGLLKRANTRDELLQHADVLLKRMWG